MTMGTVAKVSFKDANRFSLRSLEKASSHGRRHLVDAVKAVYDDVERSLSIWNKDSEISRYTTVENVSPVMRPCYEAAFRLQKVSGGVFNPFWRGRGTGPDLGGIAKGFAVDLAAEKLKPLDSIPSDPKSGVLLDLGGNLKVLSGEWRTGIRNPYGDVCTILLTNGMACATSGEYERGKHIYDGRTGMAVSNNLVSVTVVHPSSAMLADGLSTTLFVLGKAEGERFLHEHYPEAEAYWIVRGE
jgi:thiamine biosynthesis lipoprotein